MTERLKEAATLLRRLSQLGIHPTGLIVNRDVALEFDQSYETTAVENSVSRELEPGEQVPRSYRLTFNGIPFTVQK